MNEIDAQKGKCLMRRIEYTPDFVNVYCDINIKWLQEIYFKSIINMPIMLFKERAFNNFHIFSNFISIDIEEWENFINKVIGAFRDNDKYRQKIIKNVNEYLMKSEQYVNDIYNNLFKKNKKPTSKQIYKCLEIFYKMDSFAVFNMYIPYNYYELLLSKLDMPNDFKNIDYAMICAFLPHRIQVRKNKLLLLKDYIQESQQIEKYISDYLINYAIYENFETIVYDNSYIKNSNYIGRELKKMSSQYTLEMINKELNEIESNRANQINNMKMFYNYIKDRDDLINIFSFLSLVVSEEERRHMIECKIFAILSEIFSYIDMDISRIGIEDIVKNYKIYGGM